MADAHLKLAERVGASPSLTPVQAQDVNQLVKHRKQEGRKNFGPKQGLAGFGLSSLVSGGGSEERAPGSAADGETKKSPQKEAKEEGWKWWNMGSNKETKEESET